MSTALEDDNKFIAFCFSKHFHLSKKECDNKIIEYNKSGKTRTSFLKDYLIKKNKSEEDIDKQIIFCNVEYEKSKKRKILKKRTIKILIFIALLSLIGVLLFELIKWIEKPKAPDLKKLSVITTTGFWAHDSPYINSKYKEKLYYGDTVVNLFDTTNGWLKFKRGDKVLFAPEKFFVLTDLFKKYDSLFANFHYDESLETVNSKTLFLAYDFIKNTLHSSTKDWYIPLQPKNKEKLFYASLSLPSAMWSVNVSNECKQPRFDLLLLSQRTPSSGDSLSLENYLLLIELLTNGILIKQQAISLNVSTPCYISIADTTRFENGIIDNNVFVESGGIKKLKLILEKPSLNPKFKWME